MTKQNLKNSKKKAPKVTVFKSESASKSNALKPRFFVQKDKLKLQSFEFPKIYRIITEPPKLAFRLFSTIRTRLMERNRRAGPFSLEQKGVSSKQKEKLGFLGWMFKAEGFWVGIGMGIVIIAIFIVFLDLNKNIAEKKAIEAEKTKILSEIQYWKEISKKYKGYRDGYFKLALLEYKVGNVEESRKYLNEVFRLDPNFEKAREFEKILTR